MKDLLHYTLWVVIGVIGLGALILVWDTFS